MKKVKLYIAISLDGYIARKDGSIDWLEALPNPNKIDYGYTAFYETIDTVIMGRKTYDQILGFDVPWPYEQCTTYLATREADFQPPTPQTKVIQGEISSATRSIVKEEGKDIWLVGGGQLVAFYLNEGLIDEMMLFIIPTIIGEGIPLFPSPLRESSFHLQSTEHYETGAVLLHYIKA
ncbi:MAG: dihydrofolate reductase family protein [Saprospiraceae bacterium]|nr:dihydrofolate reductase family protein [Saprospiraceae bacterium]